MVAGAVELTSRQPHPDTAAHCPWQEETNVSSRTQTAQHVINQ